MCVYSVHVHSGETWSCWTTFSWCRFKNPIIGQVWYLQDILAAGHGENHERRWVLSSVTVTNLLTTRTHQTLGLPSHTRSFSRLLISEDGVNGTAIHPVSQAGALWPSTTSPSLSPIKVTSERAPKHILCPRPHTPPGPGAHCLSGQCLPPPALTLTLSLNLTLTLTWKKVLSCVYSLQPHGL